MLRERMRTLVDATDLAAPLLNDVVLDESIPFPPQGVDAGVASAMLREAITAVEADVLDRPGEIVARLRTTAKELGAKPAVAFKTLYVAILGTDRGVPVDQAMAFLGKESTLFRLRTALARLG